jgi:hypothetical protein
MRNRLFTLAYGLILTPGMAGPVVAQDKGTQRPSAREQLQHIHPPQSIDQELARLTKDLELSPEQRQQVRPLLDEHHDRIQALLDKNKTASRQELGPEIHAISDETHHKIHVLLTDHRRELERQCNNASTMVKKTGDLRRLRQRRHNRLPRPLDISGLRPKRKGRDSPAKRRDRWCSSCCGAPHCAPRRTSEWFRQRGSNLRAPP